MATAVARAACMLAWALTGACAAWASADIPPSAYAYKAIGELAAVHIANGTAHSVEGGHADCAGLTLDARRVEYFWQHAVVSAQPNYRQGLDQGDCQAEAQVQLKKTRKGRLSLDNATGWGVLQIGKAIHYLYCESCESLMDSEFGFPSVR